MAHIIVVVGIGWRDTLGRIAAVVLFLNQLHRILFAMIHPFNHIKEATRLHLRQFVVIHWSVIVTILDHPAGRNGQGGGGGRRLGILGMPGGGCDMTPEDVG